LIEDCLKSELLRRSAGVDQMSLSARKIASVISTNE